MTTIIGQLLEKLAEVEQRLEISDKTAYKFSVTFYIVTKIICSLI